MFDQIPTLQAGFVTPPVKRCRVNLNKETP